MVELAVNLTIHVLLPFIIAEELQVVRATGMDSLRLVGDLVQSNVGHARQGHNLQSAVPGLGLHVHVLLLGRGVRAHAPVQLPKLARAAGVGVDVQEHEALGVADELWQFPVLPLVVAEDEGVLRASARMHGGDEVPDTLLVHAVHLLGDSLPGVDEQVARLALRAMLVKLNSDLRLLPDGEVVDQWPFDFLFWNDLLAYALDLHDLPIFVVDLDMALPNVVRSHGGPRPPLHHVPQKPAVVLQHVLGVLATPTGNPREVISSA
mmetsp:Transcript_80648/g.231579  ORF Transcript_80648/g.231579 Transcript_80648/m.231579 type:complete len:264 (+) Transcript_80648:392-1183(+)